MPDAVKIYNHDGTEVDATNPFPIAGTFNVGDVTIDTTGLATEVKQDTGNASLSSINTKTPALGQALAAASTPVVLTAAQITTLTPPAAITGFATEATLDARLGALTETAPATDTASSGLSGRLQRIAQRITSLIALVPAALTGSGNFKVAVQEALPAGTAAIGKLAANSGVDIGDVDITSLPALTAGTAHIGAVGASDTFIEVTPTLDTSAYASGDTLFAATQVASVPRASGTTVILESIVVVDKDDQGIAFDIHFFDRSVTFGTLNAAPSISDSDAAFSMGFVAIASTDYKDLGGARVACIKGIGLEMKPNATDIYIGGVTGGTPTHTASGLIIKFGFLRS